MLDSKQPPYFTDFSEIGEVKMVGYMPISTMKEYAGKDSIKEVQVWATQCGFKSKVILKGSTASGALYVWSEKPLQAFLEKHRLIIEQANIPASPEKYIDHIEHFLIEQKKSPAAHILIGKTFNDIRFRKIVM